MAWPRILRTRRRRLALALAPLAPVLLGIVVVIQPGWAFTILSGAFPEMTFKVKTSARVVALTFDDGPDDVHTPRVLEVLARHRARATFFMIGDRAVGRQQIVRSVRQEGHEIGNHYFTIGSALRASNERFLADVVRTEKALGLADANPKLFRPPSGQFTASQLEVLKARGYIPVLGSAYPFDTSRPPAPYMRWLVTKNLEPGAIVILHDGVKDPSNMLAALDEILAEGARRGFKFVTAGELLRTIEP
jgi:peptidoglycan/xylan/chitin deacetylase (PgdA/CDA1 family)